MSNPFLGLTMLVTLNSPPGAQLKGVVSSIEPGKSLTLQNVTCPANGKYLPEITVNAADVIELLETTQENPVPTIQAPTQPPVPKLKTFEDPAILSMGKRPVPSTRPSFPELSDSTSMQRLDSTRTATAPEDKVPGDITTHKVHIANAVDGGGADGLIVEELEVEVEVAPEQPTTKSRRRPRRRQARRAHEDSIQESEVTPAKETQKSNGWRQTPLLEPNPSFQPFTTLKKKKGRGDKPDENGWATEDATDVQEMGDFDFEGSLAKFDKHGVFTQLRTEDEIADEDRLVAHNRLPRPAFSVIMSSERPSSWSAMFSRFSICRADIGSQRRSDGTR